VEFLVFKNGKLHTFLIVRIHFELFSFFPQSIKTDVGYSREVEGYVCAHCTVRGGRKNLANLYLAEQVFTFAP